MSGHEKDRLIEHQFDGIQEYDNKLPNWWLWTLYGTIAFAVVYWLFFHTFSVGLQPEARYQVEMAKAAEAQLARMAGQEITDESLSLMATIPERVTKGRAIFEQFCVVCHGPRGEGNVGPNLTDHYWIHGGRPTQILQTVRQGVPTKGMAAWANQLGPTRVQAVVAYVLTIKGTDVPGKAPQGTLEDPSESPSPAGSEGDDGESGEKGTDTGSAS